MSTNLTKSQIENIIKEEVQTLLSEAVTAERLKDLYQTLRRVTSSENPKAMFGQLLSKYSDLTGSALIAFGKNADDINKIAKELKRIRELPGIINNKKMTKLIDDRVSELTSAAQKIQQKQAFAKKAAGAGALAALGGGAALMSSDDPSQLMSVASASQLEDLPDEAFSSIPDEEIMSLPPEKKQVVKKKAESAKAKRTRIAHLAIAAKNAKDSVIKLQSRLGALGYNLGKYGVDGDYGPATVKAVKDFQWANDLAEDGIVGKNTWKVLSGQGAQGPGKSGNGAGIGDGEGLGAGLLSSLRSMDKNDEKLKYVYNATRVALTRALEKQGVPNRAAFNTAQGYLPPVTPNPYGNTMDVVKEKRILAISNLLKKGIKVRLGDKDIVLSPEVIYDSLKAAIARGEALKEGIAHSLVFNNQTRLLD